LGNFHPTNLTAGIYMVRVPAAGLSVMETHSSLWPAYIQSGVNSYLHTYRGVNWLAKWVISGRRRVKFPLFVSPGKHNGWSEKRKHTLSY